MRALLIAVRLAAAIAGVVAMVARLIRSNEVWTAAIWVIYTLARGPLAADHPNHSATWYPHPFSNPGLSAGVTGRCCSPWSWSWSWSPERSSAPVRE